MSGTISSRYVRRWDEKIFSILIESPVVIVMSVAKKEYSNSNRFVYTCTGLKYAQIKFCGTSNFV